MKKVLFVLFIFMAILLTGCKKNSKTKEEELYFDDMGVAIKERDRYIFTTENTVDLKQYFYVGSRIDSYGKKKGVTTYEDIRYTIKDWDSDICSVSSDGIATCLRKGTATITLSLLEEDINYEGDYNRGINCLIVSFCEDQIFGTWEAENEYLDMWLKDGEKKGTVTLVFNEDLTYTITTTEGIFSLGSYNITLENKTITGKLFYNSGGMCRKDDNSDYNISYDFYFATVNSLSDSKLYLITGWPISSNSYSGMWFLPKVSE